MTATSSRVHSYLLVTRPEDSNFAFFVAQFNVFFTKDPLLVTSGVCDIHYQKLSSLCLAYIGV